MKRVVSEATKKKMREAQARRRLNEAMPKYAAKKAYVKKKAAKRGRPKKTNAKRLAEMEINASVEAALARAGADSTQVGGSHYKDLAIQPWEAMEAWLTREEFIGFLKGNIIKYMARTKGKDDLAKAYHYNQKLNEVLNK